jgi:hypothetical protein
VPILKLIMSASAAALVSKIACLREPRPMSLVFVTVKVAIYLTVDS